MSAPGQSDLRHLLGLLVQRCGREAQHFVDRTFSDWIAVRSLGSGASATVDTIAAGMEHQKMAIKPSREQTFSKDSPRDATLGNLITCLRKNDSTGQMCT